MNELKNIAKENWIVLVLMFSVVIISLIIFFNSPLYQERLALERDNIIQNISLNYASLTTKEIESYKEKYNIKDSEIFYYSDDQILSRFMNEEKGEIQPNTTLKTPTLDIMNKVEPYLVPIFAAGVAVYVYKSFGLKKKIQKIIEDYNEQKKSD